MWLQAFLPYNHIIQLLGGQRVARQATSVSRHAAEQRLVKFEKRFVDLGQVIIAVFDEKLNDDVKNAAAGKGQPHGFHVCYAHGMKQEVLIFQNG